MAQAAEAPDPTSGNPNHSAARIHTRSDDSRAARWSGRGGRRWSGRGTRSGWTWRRCRPRRSGRWTRVRAELNKFLHDEGVLVVVRPGNGPDGGTVMGSAAGDRHYPRRTTASTLGAGDQRALQSHGAADSKRTFPSRWSSISRPSSPSRADSFNITAEIPGTNPDSGVVMVGGHFDSWTGGTGATDNGAGSAGGDGSDAHSEVARSQDAAHRAPGIVDGRRRRNAGLARIRKGSLRRCHGHETEARMEQAIGVLQPG